MDQLMSCFMWSNVRGQREQVLAWYAHDKSERPRRALGHTNLCCYWQPAFKYSAICQAQNQLGGWCTLNNFTKWTNTHSTCDYSSYIFPVHFLFFYCFQIWIGHWTDGVTDFLRNVIGRVQNQMALKPHSHTDLESKIMRTVHGVGAWCQCSKEHTKSLEHQTQASPPLLLLLPQAHQLKDLCRRTCQIRNNQ